jgi:CubicO group peptidase (beta-lactamase class C family)
VKSLLLSVLLTIALALAVVAGTDGRFWWRLFTENRQTPATMPGWVEPTEEVVGGVGAPLTFAAEGERSIPGEALERALGFAADKGSFSLLVSHRSVVQLEHYAPGYSAERITETYSMAKSVMGLVLSMAVADGEVPAFDAPVASYLTEWQGTDRGRITIGQLAHMASGLEHFPFNFSLWQNPYHRSIRSLLGTDVAAALLKFQLTEPPGSSFNYNSANTELATVVLERATGERYAKLVSGKLWQPLGAQSARVWLDGPGGTPRTYAYFHARPRDWLRLGMMLADGGCWQGRRVVSKAALKLFLTPAPTNPNYGAFVWLGSPYVAARRYNRSSPASVPHAEPYLADDLYLFDGGGGQRLYVVPSHRLAIVRTGEVRRDWEDSYLPNTLLAALGSDDDRSVRGPRSCSDTQEPGP